MARTASEDNGRSKTLFRSQTAPVLPLPPRKLHQKDRRWRLFWSVSIPAVLSIGASLLVFATWYAPFADQVSTTCDLETTSGIEQYFVIDIRVAYSLNFAQARWIDIAWEILVGQVGRLIHGWLYYTFVLCPSLGRMMELSSIPYVTYIDLSLRDASLRSLWTSIRSVTRVKGPRLVTSMLFHVFAIGYVLVYASLWSATSGYTNPSTSVWPMPDGSFIRTNQTDLLSLCWTHNDPRLQGVVPNVISSPALDQPSIGSSFSPRAGQLYENGIVRSSLYKELRSDTVNTSSETYQRFIGFIDVFNYVKTQQSLFQAIDRADYWRWLPGRVVSAPVNDTTVDVLNESKDQLALLSGMFRRVHGWLYGSRPSDLNGTNSQLGSTFDFRADAGVQRTDGDQGANGWAVDYVRASNYTPSQSLSNIPYNSSMIYKGTLHSFSSPFVSFGTGCKPLLSVGEDPRPCLCYRGIPLQYSVSDKMKCVSDDGFIWGFSLIILVVAMSLELGWIIGCWGVWLDCYRNSRLMKLGRSNTGPIRSAFDLVSTAQNRLGPDHSAYSDRELRMSLESCSSISYRVRDDGTETEVELIERDIPRRRKKAREMDEQA